MMQDNLSINLPDIMKTNEGRGREVIYFIVYNSIYFCQSILISNITSIMSRKNLLRSYIVFYIMSS